MSKEKISEAGEFAKKHWPKIVAATTAGASIILLIRYYRKKKTNELLNEGGNLTSLENEAEVISDVMAVLLETGQATMNEIPESSEMMRDLSEGVDDSEAKESMEVLSQLNKY